MTSASDQLIATVTDAVAAGRLDRCAGRLILLHRVFDVPSHEVASELGCSAGQVRRYRHRAELHLADAHATRPDLMTGVA